VRSLHPIAVQTALQPNSRHNAQNDQPSPPCGACNPCPLRLDYSSSKLEQASNLVRYEGALWPEPMQTTPPPLEIPNISSTSLWADDPRGRSNRQSSPLRRKARSAIPRITRRGLRASARHVPNRSATSHRVPTYGQVEQTRAEYTQPSHTGTIEANPSFLDCHVPKRPISQRSFHGALLPVYHVVPMSLRTSPWSCATLIFAGTRPILLDVFMRFGYPQQMAEGLFAESSFDSAGNEQMLVFG
jgi:hypothetical protein